MRTELFIFFAFLCISRAGYSQPCTTLGQTPSTALPVCNSASFSRTTIPHCNNKFLFVPGCSQGIGDLAYDDRNPFWYRFTCSTTGTLGFLISPHARNEDYDWQLFDITGRNPNDVYADTSLVVAGNWASGIWAGGDGTTGTSPLGFPGIVCASEDERFSLMPDIIEGHEYLLLISCFTDGQDGYTLSFDGGTAVINDSTQAHMQMARSGCDNKITLKLNKKMRCSSLTATGSEFSLSPADATIVAATATTCSSGALYVEELTLTLSNTLTKANYELMIGYGTDGNTLLDDCDGSIAAGEKIPFLYNTTQPVFADSIGRPGCAPDAIKIYFPKRIDCSTIAADGSDFIITGPSRVTVVSAAGACANGFSEVVTVRTSAPISTKGNYSLALKAGTDGTTIYDECDIELPQQTLAFQAADTVSAGFVYSNELGCRFNTLTFSHDGAHDVDKWSWLFGDSTAAATQTHTIVLPASGTNDAQLIVTNGTCSDTAYTTITMDNEVKADFEMPDIICPEDPVNVTNISTGTVDTWQWSFGNISSSTLKDPAPQYFPQNNTESNYSITLKVSNNMIGCSDSTSKSLRVPAHCIIAVPSAFTPNDDGLNDFLYPINALKATNLEFKVFNRWGKLVFFTHNLWEKWDGKVHGVIQPPGVFVWYLRYMHSVTGQKVFQKGTTMLIR